MRSPVRETHLAILGDIGGQIDVFLSALSALGVDKTGRIPDGLRLVQVGDLVKWDPALRARNEQVVSVAATLLSANPDGAYVQLLGNHDAAALGGPRRPSWPVPEQWEHPLNPTLETPEDLAAEVFTSATTRTLAELWKRSDIALAHAVRTQEHGDVLLTHAGLTRERMKKLGLDSTRCNARRAARTINRDAGAPISSFGRPGRLVTSCTDESADTLWAEVNRELYTPWIQASDLPFTQVHGHASPFNWQQDRWWPDTPAEIIERTVVLPRLRRTITQLGATAAPGFVSVDWGLGADPISGSWPVLTLTLEE